MSNLSLLTAAQFTRAAEIQEQIEDLNVQLAAILNGAAPVPALEIETVQPTKKGKFSAAGLARLRAAQKARRAKIKEAKEVESAPKPEKAKRRKMSAAARAKIAAAQKARWAKFHAGK